MGEIKSQSEKKCDTNMYQTKYISKQRNFLHWKRDVIQLFGVCYQIDKTVLNAHTSGHRPPKLKQSW